MVTFELTHDLLINSAAIRQKVIDRFSPVKITKTQARKLSRAFLDQILLSPNAANLRLFSPAVQLSTIWNKYVPVGWPDRMIENEDGSTRVKKLQEFFHVIVKADECVLVLNGPVIGAEYDDQKVLIAGRFDGGCPDALLRRCLLYFGDFQTQQEFTAWNNTE